MADWDAVSRELFAFFVALNETDKDIHLDAPELGLLTKAIRNTCSVVAVLNDYRISPFVKINAKLDDNTYLDTIVDVHRTFLSGLHIYFERALLDWGERHKITKKSSSRAIVSAAISRLKTQRERQDAHNLLQAFEVVRNKVSHSDTTLAPGDIKKLTGGGFDNWIDGKRLNVSFDKYPPVVGKLVKLFRDIDATGGRA